MKRTVLWLPAHPAEGYASMDRYWRELEKCVAARTDLPFQASCPLGAAPAQSVAAGRWEKAFRKYLVYPLQVRKSPRCDVAHLLDHSYAHLLRHLPRSTFKIATVHDLAPLEDPSGLTPAQLDRFRRSVASLVTADLLLADSAYTASALRNFLQKPKPIEVLQLGVDSAAYGRPVQWRGSTQLPAGRKILSIGSSVGRKNLQVLPEVLRQVTKQSGQVTLIRVGERLPTSLRAALDAAVSPAQVVELGGLPEDQLIALYQQVDLLFFPSTLEGFGLPLLEAMAAGCPVVSSDASSLPEVGGEAALYFDPRDSAQAAAQIVRLFAEPALRGALIARGRERAATLSWERHLEKLTDSYRRR